MINEDGLTVLRIAYQLLPPCFPPPARKCRKIQSNIRDHISDQIDMLKIMIEGVNGPPRVVSGGLRD